VVSTAETASKGSVLVVDDDRAMCEFLEEGLPTIGFTAETRTSARDALERLGTSDFDAVVTDLRMPGVDGHELCREIASRYPDVAVIVLTAFGTYETAVEAIRAGAYDFLSKPVRLDALSVALTRAIERRALRREVQRLRRSLDETRGVGDLLGESPAMQEVYRLIDRIAGSGASVLITGESGTGKEVVARTLHRRGPHAAGPFVAINCAAVPEPLLEAELFGYEKGAFTDAKTSHTGLFVEANGGTLFLDEIGDMPLGLQAKILRALQERTTRPLGGRRELPFDARIVAATNRDLATLIEQGRFREDLFFRINVIQVDVPPLRARGNDVLLLGQHFLETLAKKTGRNVVGIESSAAAKLLEYPWPGNVRELHNGIERAVALTRHDHVTVADLPERVVAYRPPALAPDAAVPTSFVTLDEMERRYVLQVLEAVGGNRSAAAKTLGLDRTTLWRKLERYGGSSGAKKP
jgi:DNA-binding NtrC family response regulator